MQKTNTVHNTTQMELTSPSVFGLKCTTGDLCLIVKSPFSMNETVTVSAFEFFKRLNNKISEYIDDDFNWSNVVIAGGLISGLLDKKYNESEYATSDIDMFVYGDSSKTIKSKMVEIYKYFMKKLNGNFFAFAHTPNAALINIVVPGKLSFQIIGTAFKSTLDVLNSFDLTHCQAGFDGTQVICTNGFKTAATTRITTITTRAIHAYRLIKAYRRGYSIRRPEYCYLKNVFHDYTQKKGEEYPSNTDKLYDINQLEQLLPELEKNPIVIQNLTKNYIPDDKTYFDDGAEEIKKIGELYAGKDKYVVLNDYRATTIVEDPSNWLVFTRIPYPI